MSVAVVQDGIVCGRADSGGRTSKARSRPEPDTPYVIGALSQTIGSTLLLRKCVDQSYADVNDHVVRWSPSYPEPSTTIARVAEPHGARWHVPLQSSATVGADRRRRAVRHRTLRAVAGGRGLRSSGDDQFSARTGARHTGSRGSVAVRTGAARPLRGHPSSERRCPIASSAAVPAGTRISCPLVLTSRGASCRACSTWRNSIRRSTPDCCSRQSTRRSGTVAGLLWRQAASDRPRMVRAGVQR